MSDTLSSLQEVIIRRLNFVGLEDVAQGATSAWINGRTFPRALTPAEWATMEGAKLCDDFRSANRQAQLRSAS